MTCQYIKKRKYFHFIYYRGMFLVKCVVWPWFQVHFLRRRIVRWKCGPPKFFICNKDHEIKMIVTKDAQEKAK